ncbi:MAG: hypothetical protein ACLVHD_08940, partial [Clostridium sp.]
NQKSKASALLWLPPTLRAFSYQLKRGSDTSFSAFLNILKTVARVLGASNVRASFICNNYIVIIAHDFCA